jgi:hypothetical protein
VDSLRRCYKCSILIHSHHPSFTRLVICCRKCSWNGEQVSTC